MSKGFGSHFTEPFLNSILQFSPEAIIVVDRMDKVLAWNSGAEVLFGVKESDAIGHYFHQLSIQPNDQQPYLNEIQRINSGQPSLSSVVLYTACQHPENDDFQIQLSLSSFVVESELFGLVFARISLGVKRQKPH